MHKLRQHHQAAEPSTINFDDALSEEESNHHSTPPSPQSNHDMEVPEIPIPKCLKDYSSPTPRGFSNAIVFPNEHTNGVLRATDIWLVQSVCKFHGLKAEDPIQHIKDFLKIVDTLHTDGATRDTSRLRFFPFTLHERAGDWYNQLPSESIFTWEQLISKFYEKFFPIGRTSTLRDEIFRFHVGPAEPIHESWIRFKDLIRQVPHHGIELWLLVQIFYDSVPKSDQFGINNSVKGKIAKLSAEEGWDRIEEYANDQDDTWDEPDSIMSVSKIMKEPPFASRLSRLNDQVSYLDKSQPTKRLSNPYLICDQCGGPHEVEECGDDTTTEQACLSSHDIFDDPSLLTFYQNNDFTPWGNLVREEGGGKYPDYKVRSTFEDDLGHFTLEKNLQLNGLDNLINCQQNDLRAKFAELNATLDGLGEPQRDPLLAITTRAGTTTKDPPYPAQQSNVMEPNTPHEEEDNVNDENPEQTPPVTPSPPTPTTQPIKVP